MASPCGPHEPPPPRPGVETGNPHGGERRRLQPARPRAPHGKSISTRGSPRNTGIPRLYSNPRQARLFLDLGRESFGEDTTDICPKLSSRSSSTAVGKFGAIPRGNSSSKITGVLWPADGCNSRTIPPRQPQFKNHNRNSLAGRRLQQRQNSPDANWVLTGILWPVVATAAKTPETTPVLTGILQNNYYALSA